MDPEVVAIAIADLHLSSKPPIFRSVERDWISVQEGYLDQLVSIANSFPGGPRPILIAGDIFDRWDAGPEAINMAIRCLRDMEIYGIPGNHDLPQHRLEGMGRSAYGTLVEAGIIRDVKPGEPVLTDALTHPMRLHGFPCGAEVTPLPNPDNGYLEIALVHDLIWQGASGYEGAPENKELKAYLSRLQGYDVAIWGDNHIPFEYLPEEGEGPNIFNCGTFLTRKRSEKPYITSVGLIFSDGEIGRRRLDDSQDKYLDEEAMIELMDAIGANSFTEALLELGDCALDFAAYLKHLLEREKIEPRVKQLILNILDKFSGERCSGR